MEINSFHTSHYAYAEETLQLADKQGFISECAAVSLKNFSSCWRVIRQHSKSLWEGSQVPQLPNFQKQVGWET